MRDLLITLFLLGVMPFCFKRPFVGLLVFSILAYMRLQDLAWGFAAVQRWSMYITILALLGYLADRYRQYPMADLRSFILIGLVVQSGVGLYFAVGDEPVDFDNYIEYVKIIFIAIFTTAVVRTQSQLRIMVWVIAMSLGFHGTKSGMASVLKGGNLFIQYGPGGLLTDNNDFALAIAMSVPWIYYLAKSETNQKLTRILILMVPLSCATVISTQSRGGALSLALMGAMLVWRSRNRLMGGMLGLAAVGVVLLAAPSEYKDRLNTIKSYEDDGSAQGRLRAWAVAFRMIDAHPVFGVGFNRFAINHLDFQPNPSEGERMGGKALVAHNSYLQIWAESGTPAFAMYMMMIFLTFLDAWRVRARAAKIYVESWIIHYANMFEASLATFCLGSLFLNRAAFDLVYHLFALVIVFGRIARVQMDADERRIRDVRAGRGQDMGDEYGTGGPAIVKGPSKPKFRRVALKN